MAKVKIYSETDKGGFICPSDKKILIENLAYTENGEVKHKDAKYCKIVSDIIKNDAELDIDDDGKGEQEFMVDFYDSEKKPIQGVAESLRKVKIKYSLINGGFTEKHISLTHLNDREVTNETGKIIAEGWSANVFWFGLLFFVAAALISVWYFFFKRDSSEENEEEIQNTEEEKMQDSFNIN